MLKIADVIDKLKTCPFSLIEMELPRKRENHVQVRSSPLRENRTYPKVFVLTVLSKQSRPWSDFKTTMIRSVWVCLLFFRHHL